MIDWKIYFYWPPENILFPMWVKKVRFREVILLESVLKTKFVTKIP